VAAGLRALRLGALARVLTGRVPRFRKRAEHGRRGPLEGARVPLRLQHVGPQRERGLHSGRQLRRCLWLDRPLRGEGQPTDARARMVQAAGYSTADAAVLSVDGATNSMTVSAPTWGTLVLSTPILFGGNATAYGLTPNTVYYVASAPTPNADQTTYTFQISAQWLQK